MLYTRKGDAGTTKLYDCPSGTRLSKSDFVFEALGTLDELNCALGFAKSLAEKSNDTLVIDTEKISYAAIIETCQQQLFCIQAEVGGSKIHASHDHIMYLEHIVREVELFLPPITSFIIPGGGETGAYLDLARTITRRAERTLIRLCDKKERIVHDESITYLNRLSSALYALARFANYQEGFSEHKPTYS